MTARAGQADRAVIRCLRRIAIAGRPDPLLLALEHGAVSLAMAAPLVVTLDRLGHRAAPAVGLVYGGTAWFVVNSLALPWIFDQPTPWQIGSQAIWGSLIVHLVFGLAVALVSQRLARARSTPVRALSGAAGGA